MVLLPNLLLDFNKEWRAEKAIAFGAALSCRPSNPLFSYAIRLWVMFIELRMVAMTIGCAFPLH